MASIAQLIRRAINAGLRVDGAIYSSMVPSITFEPTIGLVASKIEKLGLDIRSFREPLTRAIKQVIIPSIRTNFEVGGRPSWEPWSESTIRIWTNMPGMRPSRALMIKSGKLKRVATQLNIWTITKESAIIRGLPDSVSYGAIHQAGYRGSNFIIPQRRFIMLQEEDEDDIFQVFEDWLAERLAASSTKGKGV